MVEVNESEISCGVLSVTGVKGAQHEDVLRAIGQVLFEGNNTFGDETRPGAFAIWSNTDRTLADYVQKKLKGVTCIGPVVNPNTGNKIYMVTWKIPASFEKYYEKHLAECSGDCPKHCKE